MEINSIEHVGWITINPERFEAFWCDILGFRILKSGKVSSELTATLFDISGGADIRRYGREDVETDIEIHVFEDFAEASTDFNRYGINHVCLNVPDKQAFLDSLPAEVEQHIYENPLGWTNVFIRDFEDNWVEVREPLRKQTIFSSSYKTPEVDELITSIVRVASPKKVVEIGAQQGKSTVLIAKGLESDAVIHTYDLFEKEYRSPPYLDTHANQQTVLDNLKAAGVCCSYTVNKGSGEDALLTHNDIDLLHIDICNHYHNVRPLLLLAVDKVKSTILLEGGIANNWQKKHDFRPYGPMLEEDWVKHAWTYATIPFNEHNAVTIMTRRNHG